MNAKKISSELKCLLIIFLFASCQSQEESGDTAFEDYKENKLIYGDSLITAKTWMEQNVGQKGLHSGELSDPWGIFTSETNRKIRFNENSVRILKRSDTISDATFKRIVEIENKNHQLKTTLDEFTDTDQEKQDKFQLKMTQELDKIREKIDELNQRNID